MPSDPTAERQLLRDVLRWARANGWEHGYIKPSDEHLWVRTYGSGRTRTVAIGWDDTLQHRVLIVDSDKEWLVASVREAVVLLVLNGIVPVELSPLRNYDYDELEVIHA